MAHRLPLGVRARWHALDPWLKDAAHTDRFANGALRAHVVEGLPLAPVLDVLRGYILQGAHDAGPWPDDDAGRVLVLRRLLREHPVPTLEDHGPSALRAG